MSSWDARFMAIAKLAASFSKDPSTKVGAVIVDQKNRVVSIGFNGFPRGVADDDRLVDRSVKYEMIVHAEANALLFARTAVDGCTAYTWPIPPCSRCSSLLIQAGIARVVAPPASPRWTESCTIGAGMMREAGVRCEVFCEEVAG